MVSAETVENTATKRRIVGTKNNTSLMAKVKGTGKSKSNVTEISESDTSKQVEETWPPNTSSQQSSLPQVNTVGEIGRTDEELWIFSVEDSFETSTFSELEGRARPYTRVRDL